MAYSLKTDSGKEIRVYSWKEWQEIRDSKPPRKGVILAKNKYFESHLDKERQ